MPSGIKYIIQYFIILRASVRMLIHCVAYFNAWSRPPTTPTSSKLLLYAKMHNKYPDVVYSALTKAEMMTLGVVDEEYVLVVRALLFMCPDWPMRTDGRGELSIHRVARHASDRMSMQMWIDAYPDGALAKANDGCLPIHNAAHWSGSWEVVQCLIDAHPACVRSKREADGYLPLHFAARSSSVEVVQGLIRCYPQGLSSRTRFGGLLPIHLASRYSTDVAVVRVLVNAFPKGLTKKDHLGKLPLHIIAQRKDVGEMFDILLSGYSHAIYVKDSDGHTPLDYMKSCKEMFPALFHGDPRIANAYGRLPLHYAAMTAHDSEEVKKLLSDYSEGALMRDNDGNSPFDYAGFSFRCKSYLYLLHHNPEFVKRRMGN